MYDTSVDLLHHLCECDGYNRFRSDCLYTLKSTSGQHLSAWLQLRLQSELYSYCAFHVLNLRVTVAAMGQKVVDGHKGGWSVHRKLPHHIKTMVVSNSLCRPVRVILIILQVQKIKVHGQRTLEIGCVDIPAQDTNFRCVIICVSAWLL